MKEGRSTLRLIVGILISMATLTALILLTDGERVLAALRKVPLPLLLAGAGLVAATLLTRAYAWRVILQDRIPLPKSFLIINVGYFVNTILPFRLGELARAFLLMPAGLGFWEALPSVALERMIDFLFALTLLLIGLPYALDFPVNTTYLYLVGGGAVLGMGLLYLLVKNRERVLRWVETTSLIPSRWRERAVRFFRSILSSMQVLTNPIRLLQVLVSMALCWGVSLGLQYLLLRAILPEAEFIWAVFALGAVAVGVSVPSSPGNIGLFEASITLALSAFGVDRSLAFTYAITSHAINLIVTTSIGAYGLYREGVGLRDVWQLNLAQKEEGS